MIETLDDAQRALARVSAMAMVDDDVRSRLETDSRPLLAEFGYELPRDIDIVVVESESEIPVARDPHSLYLVIPNADDLSEDDLSLTTISASSCQSTASTACTTPSCVSSASTASTQCA